jgi:hypothetical protein
MAVPNTFASSTTAIPLANLDANFSYYDTAYSIVGTTVSFNGNVGIGTTSPNSRMSVAVSSTSTSVLSSYANIPLLLQNTSSTDNNWSVIGVQDAAGDFSSYIGTQNTSQASNTAIMAFATNGGSGATERIRIDSAGNAQLSTGAVMPYAPAPTGIAAATTLTNANIQGQIISATGTTYTITMPLGTTMETLATWATTNIAYDFFVINTASGVITMAVNTGVTSLGSLTVSIGASAHFRIRRTAANTFVLYRLV